MDRIYSDEDLRIRALELTLGNCGDTEYYENTNQFVSAADTVFKFLKDGTLTKEEVDEK